jgi:cytochrome c
MILYLQENFFPDSLVYQTHLIKEIIMKKFLIIFCSAGLISCSGNNQDQTNNLDTTQGINQTAKTHQTDVDTNLHRIGTQRNNQPVSKGDSLIASSDCGTCHKPTEKLIGPAFADIAKKYEATSERIDSLAGKIIKGGAGVWGEIPMTAHPDIKPSDAKEMVKYILSLKN